uniref:Uncharacterized protein n=1 Tax=Stereomyxa ramosa TaxID=1078864 RepID=A0A7S2AB26_9EUKA|mmetsp:Transcript_408/g.486  ORF Transcript_408/g.486 Transcript_408/m.486 type:complete len:196 (+) Transcript_408:1-588(+)
MRRSLLAGRNRVAGLVTPLCGQRKQLFSVYSFCRHETSAAPEEPDRKVSIEDDRKVGMERFESLGLEEAYEGESILRGDFGTKESPVIVRSWFDSRIVGCVGGKGETGHDLLWHEVRKDRPLVCLECGQYFSLRPHPFKLLLERDNLKNTEEVKQIDEMIVKAESEERPLTSDEKQKVGTLLKQFVEKEEAELVK